MALEATAQVSLVQTCMSPEIYNVCNVHTGKLKGAVDHVTLANRWQISLEIQRNGAYVLCCIQHSQGIFVLMTRCCVIGDYYSISYSNTMFCPKVPSVRGYTIAQIFATDFGWSQSYPMSCKSEAHEALGLLFVWEGAPLKMIIDGAKGMKLGEFASKCK